jgi:hypothetical protein
MWPKVRFGPVSTHLEMELTKLVMKKGLPTAYRCNLLESTVHIIPPSGRNNHEVFVTETPWTRLTTSTSPDVQYIHDQLTKIVLFNSWTIWNLLKKEPCTSSIPSYCTYDTNKGSQGTSVVPSTYCSGIGNGFTFGNTVHVFCICICICICSVAHNEQLPLKINADCLIEKELKSYYNGPNAVHLCSTS